MFSHEGDQAAKVDDFVWSSFHVVYDPTLNFMFDPWICSNIPHPQGGGSFVHATSCGHMVNNAATHII